MRINSTRINRTDLSPASSNTTVEKKPLQFHDTFDFTEIEDGLYKNILLDETRAELARLLTNILIESLQQGINIRYSKMRKYDNFVMEARFEIKKQATGTNLSIYLPVFIREDILANSFLNKFALHNYVGELVDNALKVYDNKELIKLIVVLAHEFGHFKSYIHGGYDQELQIGLELMHENKVIGTDKYTHLVFIEESRAWSYAHELLAKYDFVYWDIFKKVKDSSLQTYISVLNLDNISTDVAIKLSYFEDYRNLSKKLFA